MNFGVKKAVKSDAARPLRFILVGGFATMIHIVAATALLTLYEGLSPFIANVLAFALAFIASFYGHRYVTFSTDGSVIRFLTVALAGFALNNVVLFISLKLSLPAVFSIVIATICVPFFSYVASVLWAFKK